MFNYPALKINLCLGRNRWNNRNKDNLTSSNRSSSSSSSNTWNQNTLAASAQEFKPNNPTSRFQPPAPGQVQRNFPHQKNFPQFSHAPNGFPNAYGHQSGYGQNGFPAQNNFHQGGYGGQSHHQQSMYQQQNRFPQNSQMRNGSGFQQQRFNRQQNFVENGSHPQGQGMYTVPPPYMMQANTEAGVQSIINHKFFQPNRPPPQNNPCAFQSGYTAQYQPAVPYGYQYSQPQTVQQ